MTEEFTCEVEGARIFPPDEVLEIGEVQPYWSACEGLGFYDEHEGKRYCVLHFPGEEKKDDFRTVLEDKLAQKDYDFGGAIFPDGTSDFGGAKFDANANFDGATFRGNAYFASASFNGEWTSFTSAQFSGKETGFYDVQFSGEWTSFAFAQFRAEQTTFRGARFSSDVTHFLSAQFSGGGSDFTRAQFSSSKGTVFSGAAFGSTETYFGDVTFTQEVVFHGATFREKTTFLGNKANPVFGSGAWAQFNRCRIDKPEQFTFNTVLLHPGWFCNTDVRKVDFTDVKWYGMPGGPKGTLVEEINALEARHVGSPHTRLAQACRRLTANAEENREYPLANEFHYWSMDALRKEPRPRSFGLIPTLYWLLSGYGVRARRAFSVLVAIALMFAVLYMLVGYSSLQVLPIVGIGQALADAGQAVMYSLGVMARLRPEPIPKEMGLFQILVTIEGILGPLQIGLLFLAVRRQVMR